MDLPNQIPTVPQSNIGSFTSTVVSDAGQNQKGSNKKRVVVLSGIVVMALLGIVSGVVLLSQRLGVSPKAWDCNRYTFTVNSSGSVVARNDSDYELPFQRAEVFIDDQKVATFDVPVLGSGQDRTIGSVQVPQNQSFSWRVQGTSDCRNSGNVSTTVGPQCLAIKVYDTNWQEILSSQLSTLRAGDKIRLVAKGSPNSSSFESVRFSVNNTDLADSSLRKTDTQDLYAEYELPAGASSFSIKAKIRYSDGVWY